MGFASAKNKFSAFGSHHHCTRFQKAGAFSSAGLEHLPYKQRVGGSNPSTPTREFRNQSGLFFVNYQKMLLPEVNENKYRFILYFAHLFVPLQHI